MKPVKPSDSSHPPQIHGQDMTHPQPDEPKKLSVLVLDDDTTVGEIVAAMVARLGEDARYVSNAESFFASLDEASADIVIIDLQMPGRDGLDVMRELGARGPAKVILSSAYGTRLLEAARHSARINGLDVIEVLPKPIRMKDLQVALEIVRGQEAKQRTVSVDRLSPRMTASMLADALFAGEIQAHFQPKLRLRDLKPCGFEALARWHHPDYGWISPEITIPLVSESGLDKDLFEIMIDQSLAFLSRLGRGDLSVAVNAPLRICAEPFFLSFYKIC